MTKYESNYRVAIYLKGDNLDPEHLTQIIGLLPSESHRKGDRWITASGSEFEKKTGLWSLLIKGDGVDISDAIVRLTSGANVSSFTELPGVEEECLDIFVAMDADDGGGGECSFSLSPEATEKVSEMRLCTRFTVAVVSPRLTPAE